MERIKLGIIGHVGHGKTTLSRALEKFGRSRNALDFERTDSNIRGIPLVTHYPEHFSQSVKDKDIVR